LVNTLATLTVNLPLRNNLVRNEDRRTRRNTGRQEPEKTATFKISMNCFQLPPFRHLTFPSGTSHFQAGTLSSQFQAGTTQFQAGTHHNPKSGDPIRSFTEAVSQSSHLRIAFKSHRSLSRVMAKPSLYEKARC
jgi:hypothetical protein